MAELEADIKQAIEAHLPAQVGKLLQDRLGNVDVLEKLVADYRKKVDRLEAEKKEWGDLDNRERGLFELDKVVRGREAAVTLRENKLEVDQANSRAKAAEDKCAAMFELAKLVFRNPTLTRHSYTNENKNVPGGGGGYPMQVSDSSSKTVTESIE